MNSVYGSGSSSSTSMGAAMESSSDRSTMKFARICPLTDILGMYYMSYSPSSMLHFCSLPANSGFDSTCLIGWSVITTIGCAWKYHFSRLLACTKASTNFSTGVLKVHNKFSFSIGTVTVGSSAISFFICLNAASAFRSPLEITFLRAFLQAFEERQ
ncbi:hypothetical protein Tco_0525462 [Tanacetum coccineum]